MSLRSRLAWTYGIAFFVAVMLLAIISIAAIDRSLRTSLDSRLTTASLAAAGLVDVHNGTLSVDPDDVSHLLAALPNDMQVAVISSAGRVYSASTTSIPVEIEDLRAWKDATLTLYSNGSGDRALRIAVAPVERDGSVYGAVVVWEGVASIADFDRNSIVAMIFAALLIGGVVVVLSSTLAHRALAPLQRFTTLATEIEAHDLSQRMGTGGADELGRLASAFDRMLDRLEAAFARQRRFTADASHELRAPLAVMRAEADVALQRERTPAQYRAALETIVAEVDRIDALVDALLLVARADSSQLRVERVDIGDLAMLTVARFTAASAARNVTIETRADEVSVDGDAQALERALAALLHNAIDFARSRVVVGAHRKGDEAVVWIEDDGPGFTSEGLSHAVDRFWRADPARTRGGTGLGLSIASAIMRAHGGRLVLTNVVPHGARVEVHLPFIAASSVRGTLDA